MKNISYLLLASILFFSNCSEEMLTEPIKITEADLVGNWDFFSLEFKDSIYFGCDEKLSSEYNLLNLSFRNVTLESENGKPSLIYYSDCGNKLEEEISFEIKDKKIILNDNNNYAYLLLNFHDFDGETLKIKSLLNAPKAPTGGIYTLKREDNKTKKRL